MYYDRGSSVLRSRPVRLGDPTLDFEAGSVCGRSRFRGLHVHKYPPSISRLSHLHEFPPSTSRLAKFAPVPPSSRGSLSAVRRLSPRTMAGWLSSTGSLPLVSPRQVGRVGSSLVAGEARRWPERPIEPALCCSSVALLGLDCLGSNCRGALEGGRRESVRRVG